MPHYFFTIGSVLASGEFALKLLMTALVQQGPISRVRKRSHAPDVFESIWSDQGLKGFA